MSAHPARRALLGFEALAGLALAGAVLLERTRSGVQLELILVALATAVLHVRRLLAVRGDHAAPGALAALLEAVALAGLFVAQPPPAWALSAAMAAAIVGRAADDGAKPPLALRALGVLSLAGAIAAIAYRIAYVPPFDDLWQTKSALLTAALAPVALEALLGPGSREASLRRAGAGAIFVAAASRVSAPGELVATIFLGLAALASLIAARAPAPDRERTRRRAALRVGVLTGVLGLVWVLGEAAFHVVPNRYRNVATPHMDLHHKPGAVFIYEGAPLGQRQPKPVLVYQNRLGYHDVDHELAKPPGTARILVLGDSFIDAVQVEQEELFHRRIQHALDARGEAPVEAIALANSGWGQKDELAVLEAQGLAFAPDLVILEFLPSNDVRNNSPELERLAGEEITRSSFARPLYARAIDRKLFFSAFVLDHLDLTIRNLRGRRDAVDAHVFWTREHAWTIPDEPELWDAAWRRTEELVATIQARVRASGATLAVVVFPSNYELDALAHGSTTNPGVDIALPARRMLDICGRLAIPCFDLGPRFAKLADWDTIHGKLDAHWTAYGHERGAAETVHFLTEETSVWKETVARARQGRSK